MFTTAFIWGVAFVAQVLGSDYVEPLTFNGIRFMLGALSLIPVYCLFERETSMEKQERLRQHKRTALGALGGGVALFCAATLQQYGISMTRDPGKAGFITGLYTVLTPVFYFLFFKRKSTWNVWIGAIMAVGGLYLLCVRDGMDPSFGPGELLILIGAFFWAGHIILVDRFIAHVSPLRFSSWQFFVCGSLSLLLGICTENTSIHDVWAAKWAILFCGLLSVGVAYTLQIFGQKYAEPTHAAIILSTESVFAALGGLLWNAFVPDTWQVDQEITLLGYVGCLIIFAGIVLSQISFGKKKNHHDF